MSQLYLIYRLCQGKWPRQILEDGDLATKQWAPDRADTDAVDPDSLTNMPKPPKDLKPEVGADAGRGKGKSSASVPEKPDDGDEDCQIIEIYDILPLSYAYPKSSTSADTSGQAVEPSRRTKRAADASTKPKKKPVKRLKQTQLPIPRGRTRPGVVA